MQCKIRSCRPALLGGHHTLNQRSRRCRPHTCRLTSLRPSSRKLQLAPKERLEPVSLPAAAAAPAAPTAAAASAATAAAAAAAAVAGAFVLGPQAQCKHHAVGQMEAPPVLEPASGQRG